MTWPFENDTAAIIQRLAKRDMQSEKRRNLMAGVAVALAAFLICFAGTLGISLSQILKNQVTDTWEVVFTETTEEQAKALHGVQEFARVGEYYAAGTETDAKGYTLSFVYSDSETLYMFRDQMRLEDGHLPQAANEIAVSDYFLSQFAPDAGIGSAVRLDTESFQGEYVICGILSSFGEKATNTYGVLISQAMLQNWAGYDPAGYRAYVHFVDDQAWEEDAMLSFCRQIAEDRGLPVPGTNIQYFRYNRGLELDTLPLLGIVTVLVLIGSSIVIQSIFRISVHDKIQSYGQLRTLGATQKQIGRMVKKEGRVLGAAGSIAGALPGAAVSLALLPKGFHAPLYLGMILLTMAICLFIVALAIRKPVKLAAAVSPLEAVRYSPVQGSFTHNRKKPRELSPMALGFMNFTRDRKRSAGIAVSLSVGGILLLVISSILLVRAPERQARQYFPDGEYKIYLDTDRPDGEIMMEGNPLNEELKQEVLAIDGVTDVFVERRAVHAEFYTDTDSDGAQCDMLTDENRARVEELLTEGTMPTDEHGILLADDMPRVYESIDIGTEMTITFGEVSLPVTVTGFYDVSALPIANGRLGLDSPRLYATEALFRALLPGVENFDYTWSIISDPNKSQAVEAGLENIVAGNADLGLDTLAAKVEFFASVEAMGFGSFQILSWLIFLFGVVNLINTTLSNQMARRRENSILRAVGLTQNQQYQMIVWEGLFYALTAAVTTIAVGLPVSIFASSVVSAMTYEGQIVAYPFPFLEMGLFLLVLFGLELILSHWTIRREKQRSLIEQMRAVE